MIKIIPREKIRHLEWKPGDEIVVRTPKKIVLPDASGYSIDDLIEHGQKFYSEEKDEAGKYIGVAKALEQAMSAMGDNGIIATMPFHIAGKAKAGKDNYLWQDWFTCLSEENVGIDTEGLYVSQGKGVVVTVHGGGILTPERIMQAYKKGLTSQNAAQYTQNEFSELLNGKLPNGEEIQIYSVDDVLKGNISNPFGRYGVWMDFETAKATASDYHKKEDFVKNPLVLSRAGTLDYLEKYFDKVLSKDTVANWHRLSEVDINQPQGRLLFLSNNSSGLYDSNNLDYNGRFIGVEERSSK